MKKLKSQQKFQDIDDVVDEEVIIKDKGNGEKGGHTVETVSTARPDISAARPRVSTDAPKTPPTTTTLFDDEDVIIVDTLVKMKSQKAKEKGVTFKDADDSAKPIRSITTLQPLQTLIQKIKIDDDHELATILTYKEQEKYTIEERSKLLAEFFEGRKKQLAKERAEAIRSKPLTKTQLRSLMMTYQKHTGSKEDEKRVGSRKKRASGSKQKSPTKKKNPNTLDVKSPIVDYESHELGTMKAEKTYPLTKEILEKMLSWRLEAKTKSTLALDLIKFIKLQIKESRMQFGGNTRDLGSFREETDENTDLHQKVLFTKRGEGVAGIKRCRRDLSGDGVWILAMASQHSRLKVDLEPSMWRRRQEHKETSSHLRKPAFVCIDIDTSREMRVCRKETIG
nr:hypothetical protein [Tanacetum cinerariifolium]